MVQEKTLQQQQQQQQNDDSNSSSMYNKRITEASKQLFCGGLAGSVGKTITAPFSRLAILSQVHSMVSTKGTYRPKYSMSIADGLKKMMERGGAKSLWRGNGTSVLHRFPYSAINFFVYEATLDLLHEEDEEANNEKFETDVQFQKRLTSTIQTTEKKAVNLARRITGKPLSSVSSRPSRTTTNSSSSTSSSNTNNSKTRHKFLAGAFAGCMACVSCYPIDLIRTRLTTQLDGRENYRGIIDAVKKIYTTEGYLGFYSGLLPTLLVAVPNFAISYTIYGTLKEYTLDDELFINFRKIDTESNEKKMGLLLTVGCGATSGIFATVITFPMDTIRRRMQIQSLHIVDPKLRLSSFQLLYSLVTKEGLSSIYRGLTPELLKVMPMVGSMFLVYEFTKDHLNV